VRWPGAYADYELQMIRLRKLTGARKKDTMLPAKS
jgi:hypothetical protein